MQTFTDILSRIPVTQQNLSIKIKGKKEWKWDDEYQKAFKKLKDKITSQSILTLLKREGKFRVETNVSEHVIQGVLPQEQEEKWKPITFYQD